MNGGHGVFSRGDGADGRFFGHLEDAVVLKFDGGDIVDALQMGDGVFHNRELRRCGGFGNGSDLTGLENRAKRGKRTADGHAALFDRDGVFAVDRDAAAVGFGDFDAVFTDGAVKAAAEEDVAAALDVDVAVDRERAGRGRVAAFVHVEVAFDQRAFARIDVDDGGSVMLGFVGTDGTRIDVALHLELAGLDVHDKDRVLVLVLTFLVHQQAVRAAEVAVDLERLRDVDVGRTPGAGTNHAAGFVRGAVENGVFSIKGDFVAFVDLKKRDTIVVLAVGGVGFEVTDAVRSGAERGGGMAGGALSIDQAVEHVGHDFVGMDLKRVVVVFELEAAVAALFGRTDRDFTGIDREAAVAVLPAGEIAEAVIALVRGERFKIQLARIDGKGGNLALSADERNGHIAAVRLGFLFEADVLAVGIDKGGAAVLNNQAADRRIGDRFLRAVNRDDGGGACDGESRDHSGNRAVK